MSYQDLIYEVRDQIARREPEGAVREELHGVGVFLGSA